MKTTLELSDAVFDALKNEAKESGASMKTIVESALRLYLNEKKAAKKAYSFPDCSVAGKGVSEGVEEGAWEVLRSAIYEGRGG